MIKKFLLLIIFLGIFSYNSVVYGSNFGNNDTSGGSYGQPNTNAPAASKFTVTTGDGSITNILWYGSKGDVATTHVKGLLFADSAGSPTTLLGSSSAIEVTEYSGTWWNMTVSPSISITNGTTYWLGVVSDTDLPVSSWGPLTGSATKEATDNNYTTPENWDATTATEANYAMAIYATYTINETEVVPTGKIFIDGGVKFD